MYDPLNCTLPFVVVVPFTIKFEVPGSSKLPIFTPPVNEP